jgi:hypothetical protein
MNTSATGGYLAESPGVAGREAIENGIHDMLAGLTGLAPEKVRPAFQGEPLAAPSPREDWCAFYVRDAAATNHPEARHIPAGDGRDEIVDWIGKEIRVYFYGPACEEYAGMVRRGLQNEQNLYTFRQSGLAVRSVGNVAQMPEQVNGKWMRRCDLVINATFEAVGRYPVLNVLGLADGGQAWTANPPPDPSGGGPEAWEEGKPGTGSFLNVNR